MLRPRTYLLTLCAIALLAGGVRADQDFGRALRVIYFTPADREPVEGYRGRLDRVMTEVQRFYATGMEAHGFGPRTFPLERDASGRLVVRLVRGAHPCEYYTGERGDDMRDEVLAALAEDGMDGERETLLLVGNFVSTDGNRLSANCPYYGGGDHRGGTAWVTDHALLDTRNLRRRGPIVYDGDRRYSVGQYNSVYIGGIAHELGHALGLPHVHANSSEEHLGTTLMGSGNYTFREELRGAGKGTFLSRASALMLADHSLFRHSDEGRDKQIACELVGLRCEPVPRGMRISGRVRSDAAPRAVIAFSDPEGGSDYDARTWDATVRADGLFTVTIGDLAKGGYELRLMFLFANGQQTTFGLPFHVDARGAADSRAAELAHLASLALKGQLAGDDSARSEHTAAMEAAFARIPEPARTPGQRALLQKAQSLAEIAASRPVVEPGPPPAEVDPPSRTLGSAIWRGSRRRSATASPLATACLVRKCPTGFSPASATMRTGSGPTRTRGTSSVWVANGIVSALPMDSSTARRAVSSSS